MKQLSRIVSAVALAAGFFASSQAMALTICSNCQYHALGATNLGVHSSLTNDGSGLRREDLVNTTLAAIPVTDTWAFELQPVGGSAQVTTSFVPISGVFSSFVVNLYSSTNTCLAGIGNTIGTSGLCSSVVLGALQASSVPHATGATVFPVTLLAGSYALVITYSVAPMLVGETAEYSGQLRLRQVVPEPGSLALVGLALIGVAASLRRNRKA